jgi:hypothetical protein
MCGLRKFAQKRRVRKVAEKGGLLKVAGGSRLGKPTEKGRLWRTIAE